MNPCSKIRLPLVIVLFLMIHTVALKGQTILIAGNTEWKYLDDGSNQDTMWQEINFDDSTWETGFAELGYGEGDESTVLSYGADANNKHITYYFRKKFFVTDPDESPYLTLKLQRDDGAVIYLNGAEVLRSNMPFNAIDYSTLASDAVSDDYEDAFFDYCIPSDSLIADTNIIAVEIHQVNPTSSDLSFNLELSTREFVPGEIMLIPVGAPWTFLDDGSDQDTMWQEINFDDSTWETGFSELGYGDGDETSLLDYGSDANDKYTTYYFRHQFYVTDPDTTPYLLLKLQRDDGAVVYLNGQEVLRSNMPDGTIDYATFAQSSVGGDNENTFFEFLIPSGQLISDTNLLAVEIHQTSLTSSDISFNVELSTTNQTPPAFRKAPYLIFSGMSTEMILLWQLFNTSSCSVEWGTNTTYNLGNQLTTEYGTDHQHAITLTNLTNSTKYYYRVVADNDTLSGHFRTGPADTISEITILAYGDTRTNPSDQDSVAEQIIYNYTNDSTTQTILLLSGDMVANGNNESDWDEQFFDPQYEHIQQMLATVPLMACVGNHEGTGLLFSKYFPYPFYDNDRFYWSFDYGPVHVCIIDQYTAYNVGSTQYQWLVSDLSSTSKQWKILVVHEPGWSAGGGHSNDLQVQSVLQPLCEQYAVQFVIAGHNHYYARAVTERVEHITTGGGGAPLHDPNPTAQHIVKVEKAHHFCELRISSDTLHLTAIKNNGDIIEEIDYYRYYTWTGVVDDSWINASNWVMGVVPISTTDVVIPLAVPNYPRIRDSVSCNKLMIQEGAVMNVESSGTLIINEE